MLYKYLHNNTIIYYIFIFLVMFRGIILLSKFFGMEFLKIEPLLKKWLNFQSLMPVSTNVN